MVLAAARFSHPPTLCAGHAACTQRRAAVVARPTRRPEDNVYPGIMSTEDYAHRFRDGFLGASR